MRGICSKVVCWAGLSVTVLLVLGLPSGTGIADEQIDFATQIRPIFAQHCYDCHGPDDADDGLQFSKSGSVFGERPPVARSWRLATRMAAS